MKRILIGLTAAMTVAAAAQAWAQTPWPAPQQAEWAPPYQAQWAPPYQAQWAPPYQAQPAPPAYAYSLNATTPDDAYRQGLINRWQLEQLAGPLPPALQGPSANGDKGDNDGGGRQ